MSKQGGWCCFHLSNPTSGQSFHVWSSFHVEFTWGQINFREENPRVRLLPVFQDPAWRHAGTTAKLTPGATGWELGPGAKSLGYRREPCSDHVQLSRQIHQCFLARYLLHKKPLMMSGERPHSRSTWPSQGERPQSQGSSHYTVLDI